MMEEMVVNRQVEEGSCVFGTVVGMVLVATVPPSFVLATGLTKGGETAA